MEAEDEETQLIETKKSKENKLGRASIAALDLPYLQLKQLQDLEEKENELKEEEASGLPANSVLYRSHSLDSGKEKIVSVPTIEEIQIQISDPNGNNIEIKQEIVVPPRDILNKMPFYSTPLTIEATNNAFRDFQIRLNEMGFIDQAEAALVATNAESVEVAVDFIMNHPDALFHRFMPSNDNQHDMSSLCNKCGLQKRDHIIDSNGDKVTDTNLSHNHYHNDLLQNIINEKVKILQRGDGEEEEENVQVEIVSAMKQEKEKKEQQEEKKEKETETEKEKEQNTGPTELCLICFEDRSLEMFYRASCGHNYCKICLETHYKIKTKDGDVLKLSCIDPKCDRMIEEDEILKFLLDEELKAKFIKFRQNKLLMLNPNARFCCKPGCEGTMIGSRLNRKLICPICGTAVCFNCSQPWHGIFVGCNQNVDIGYTKWALNKDVQKCPKCRMGIEKDDGCNHMTCSSCSYEFCWICKGPYNDHHFEWWNIFGCPGAQYTPRFCRCPHCFPRWLNRIFIILCFLSIVIPIVVIAAIFWILIICLIFCIRCDFRLSEIDCCCF